MENKIFFFSKLIRVELIPLRTNQFKCEFIIYFQVIFRRFNLNLENKFGTNSVNNKSWIIMQLARSPSFILIRVSVEKLEWKLRTSSGLFKINFINEENGGGGGKHGIEKVPKNSYLTFFILVSVKYLDFYCKKFSKITTSSFF